MQNNVKTTHKHATMDWSTGIFHACVWVWSRQQYCVLKVKREWNDNISVFIVLYCIVYCIEFRQWDSYSQLQRQSSVSFSVHFHTHTNTHSHSSSIWSTITMLLKSTETRIELTKYRLGFCLHWFVCLNFGRLVAREWRSISEQLEMKYEQHDYLIRSQ